jgi:aryl-alcohol dehydrogenase-like predicted oxidoreductase
MLSSKLSNTRRRFMQYMTLASVGSQALVRTGNARAALFEARESAGLAEPWPAMTYRKLGRTGYSGSRLIFGCGAALSGSRRDDLLNAAFDAGVNVFDVGYSAYYDDAEKNLAPFLRQRRDDIFLISKAVVPVDIRFDEVMDVPTAKKAAAAWLKLLEGSLTELKVDHVDAYYLMASNNVSVITNEEIHTAFEKASAAGKVSHLGLSTHQNAENVLKAAIDTDWYSLATIAITPGGWYDWIDRKVLEGTPPMKDLQPLLTRAREAGMGLVGMKAGRFLAGRRFLGWGNPAAFDEFYDRDLLQAKLSEFQRSYAFVLAHGLDAVNADMQNMMHLKENFIAAATSHNYFNVA